ncbi:MAG: hypothetical protein SPL41_05265 [Succinivibrionaceae bacterium]|nr:hypothetical protein [Succinivibrionaceae bacterium]
MKSASAGAHSDVSDPKGLFVVGVDLASRSIRLCSEDPGTGEILNREVSREEFEGLIRKRGGPSMRLVMEACGSSNYWGEHRRDERTCAGHCAGEVRARLQQREQG